MKRLTALQIFLAVYGLFSLWNTVSIGNVGIANITGVLSVPSNVAGFLGNIASYVSLIVAGLIELYKRLKDRNWKKKYEKVVVTKPLPM